MTVEQFLKTDAFFWSEGKRVSADPKLTVAQKRKTQKEIASHFNANRRRLG